MFVLLLLSGCSNDNFLVPQDLQKVNLFLLYNREFLDFQAIDSNNANFLMSINRELFHFEIGLAHGSLGLFPENFSGRTYPNSLIYYREDLPKLIGIITTKNGEAYLVGVIPFLKVSAKLKVDVSKDGMLMERKLEKEMKKIGMALIGDDEISQYSIEDQARVMPPFLM